VQIPRVPEIKKGLFACRSPHRPNNIGLSLVRLVAVDGLNVKVSGLDALDGTPVLDSRTLHSVYTRINSGQASVMSKRSSDQIQDQELEAFTPPLPQNIVNRQFDSSEMASSYLFVAIKVLKKETNFEAQTAKTTTADKI
jgi:hypothetical protein